MSRIFLNYRGADGNFAAEVLDRELTQRYGADAVFRACRTITPGVPFRAAIIDALTGVDVLVALIDPAWEGAGPAGRRIDDPDDFVRREVRTALERGCVVIPVLLPGVAPLAGNRLPADIAPLAGLQYVRLSARQARLSVAPLLTALDPMLGHVAVPDEPATAAPPAPQPAAAPHGAERHAASSPYAPQSVVVIHGGVVAPDAIFGVRNG